MEVARLKRYKDKLSHISHRQEQVGDWLGRVGREDDVYILATYKAFQEMAEAAMDIIAMIVRDCDETPKDDYANIDFVVRKGIIKPKTADVLRQANGLRNRLVHAYNGLDERRAHSSIVELLNHFEEFCDAVSAWLEKQ